MKETKYELVKELTGKAIAESACGNEFEKFVRHCGYHEPVVWDLEFEKYVFEQDGWISFLEKKRFLTRREEKVIFDTAKVYCANINGDIYKIGMVNRENHFAIMFIGSRNSASSSFHHAGAYFRDKESFGSLISRLKSDQYNTKVFSSLREALDHYKIDM